MTWPLCQLCQWSIQCSTYCSTNIGIFYDLPIWAIFGSNLSIWVRKIEIESKNIVAGMDSFISAINDIYIKVKQGFVTKRRGFFSKCLFLCCLRLRVNDMTWLICQLCQWSIQYSTYCSTNIGIFLWSSDLGYFWLKSIHLSQKKVSVWMWRTNVRLCRLKILEKDP